MADKVQIDRDLLERLQEYASMATMHSPHRYGPEGRATAEADNAAAVALLASSGVTSGATPKQDRSDPWLNPGREICGHCGLVALGSAYVGGMRVCHPDDERYLDCYQLVTVYKEPLGTRISGAPPVPEQPDDEYFRTGYAAFGMGQDSESNPYPPTSYSWVQWNRGMYEASVQAEDGQ